MAASVVRGRDEGSMARKGVLKEPVVTDRLSDHTGRHSRPVPRFKLQLRDRQDARRSQAGRDMDDRPTPLMAWVWSMDAE